MNEASNEAHPSDAHIAAVARELGVSRLAIIGLIFDGSRARQEKIQRISALRRELSLPMGAVEERIYNDLRYDDLLKIQKELEQKFDEKYPVRREKK